MKTRNIRPLLFTLSLAVALVASAQAPDKKPEDTKPDENKPAANALRDNIELDVSFVTFDLKDIEEIARKSPTAAPTQEQVLKAWAAGRGRLLASGKVITLAGQQSKTEGVLEKIYPTEYEPPRVADKKTAATTKDDWVSQPTPGGFQTRNIGLTVNATAVVNDDRKSISVTMVPELAEFLGWSNIEAGETEGKKTSKVWMSQPDYYTRRTAISLDIPVDGTVVYGGMPDSTGKQVTYVFVTAHIVQPAQKK